MNRILGRDYRDYKLVSFYDNRCRCISKTKSTIVKGRVIPYPDPETVDPDFELDSILSQTFQIKYQNQLSLTAKLVLNNFQNKYIYYAIDDILNTFKSSPIECKNLLAILYSPMISLQNNFSINFFDIWIDEVCIEEVSNPNKFLNSDSQSLDQVSYITIKFVFLIRPPVKKEEPIW